MGGRQVELVSAIGAFGADRLDVPLASKRARSPVMNQPPRLNDVVRPVLLRPPDFGFDAVSVLVGLPLVTSE